MRRFYIGDIVQYIDDGSFPTLNNQCGEITDINKKLGCSMLQVEFTLPNMRNKFTYSFNRKRFKLVKRAQGIDYNSNYYGYYKKG